MIWKPPIVTEMPQNSILREISSGSSLTKQRKPVEWEKIPANHTTDQGSISNYTKQLIQLGFNKGK